MEEQLDVKVDIAKTLKEAKEANEKILEFLDAGVLNLEDDSGKEKISDTDSAERAQDAEMFWRRHYKNYLKKRVYDILYEMCLKAEIPTQVTYYRGMLENCIETVEWFKKQIGISEENRKSRSGPEQGIPPVGNLEVDK